MSDYRRYFVPGGTYFFTLVTDKRRPLFASESNIDLLRTAIRLVKHEHPFEINAAVILPDHLYFIWSLPSGDDAYSKRIGRIKAKFTQLLRKSGDVVASRDSMRASKRKHRERDVWQRRFWEHTIEDEEEFEVFFDYIHYNPVKHGLVSCPHFWETSSFHYWVDKGVCEATWGCQCTGHLFDATSIMRVEDRTGEPF